VRACCGGPLVKLKDHSSRPNHLLPDAVETKVINFEDFISAKAGFSLSTFMVHRGLLDDVKPWFQAKYRVGEDWEFRLRIAKETDFSYLDFPAGFFISDGREHLAGNAIRNREFGVLIAKDMYKAESCGVRKRIIKRNIGRIHYNLSRDLSNEGRYFASACNILTALWHYPFVGSLIVKKGEKATPGISILKVYLAIPVAISRGLLNSFRGSWKKTNVKKKREIC